MKIKHFILTTLAIASFSLANGQVSYGIKAGLNLNKTNATNIPVGYKQSNYVSLFLTGYAEVGLGKNFAVQPGVSLQSKGDKYTENGDVVATWDVMSIEVPVNLLYYIPTGNSGSVFLGAGPYVGFNISGKNKLEKDWLGMKAGDRTMKFTGSNKDQNLIDAGANFLLGYKLSNGFLINAEYGLGIANQDPGQGNNNLHNKTIRFGVGFQF